MSSHWHVTMCMSLCLTSSIVAEQQIMGNVWFLTTVLPAGRLWVLFSLRSLEFLNLPDPSSCTMALGLTQHLTKWILGIFLGLKGGWCARLTTLLLPVSQLSRKHGSLNISQPYGIPWPIGGIALCFSFTLMNYICGHGMVCLWHSALTLSYCKCSIWSLLTWIQASSWRLISTWRWSIPNSWCVVYCLKTCQNSILESFHIICWRWIHQWFECPHK